MSDHDRQIRNLVKTVYQMVMSLAAVSGITFDGETSLGIYSTTYWVKIEMTHPPHGAINGLMIRLADALELRLNYEGSKTTWVVSKFADPPPGLKWVQNLLDRVSERKALSTMQLMDLIALYTGAMAIDTKPIGDSLKSDLARIGLIRKATDEKVYESLLEQSSL